MRAKLMLMVLAGTLAAPALSLADGTQSSLTWQMRSFHHNAVEVQFYSNSRKHVWPAPGRVYAIRDYAVHTYTTPCIKGEKVCYGAWVAGSGTTYWGTGKDGRLGCADCCYTCNGSTTPIRNLNERR